MSLFTRTAAEAETLAAALDKHESERNSLAITARKASLDALQASLSKLTPVVDKFVSKADMGEADPNRRLYGAAMVTKIRALAAKLSDISTRIEAEGDTVTPLYEAHVEAEEKAKAEELRVAKEKEEAEAARKAEEERKAAEEEVRRKQEEERVKAEQEAREKEQAEQRRQAALTLAKMAEEKRKAEEAAAAEKKAREAAEVEAKAKEQAAREEAERKAAEAKVQAGISLTVKTAKSKTLPLKGVPPTCTVAELKSLIAKQHDIPQEAQRLIFQGRLLTDAKTIDSFKIADGSAVHLVENYRGVPSASARSAPKSTVTETPKPVVPPGTVCHLADGKTEFTRILENCGGHRLVVVDWFAPWCGPCKMIAPVFERLASRFSDVTFVKVDTEASPANAQLATEKGISAYPTFHFYISGNMVHTFSGAVATKIEASIKKYRAQVVGAGGSSAAGAGPSSSGSSGLTQRVLTALTNLKNNCPVPEFIVAVRTLLTFVRNVVDHPGEEKYRKVRTANNTFQTRLASKTGGVECMQAFGFESRQENGESYLVLSAEAAANPELPTVRRQLEQALAAVSGSDEPSSQPRGSPSTNTGGTTGANPQMGAGFPGMPGFPQLDPALLNQMAADPSFMQLARDMAADPSIYSALLQSQQAIQSGDFATLQRLMQDPAITRFMQNLGNNPALMEAMRRHGNMAGMPGMAGMMGTQPGATDTQGGQPGTGQQQPANGAAANFPPPYPGAPTTAEEEDRLLQEAIRLSMQDSHANQQKPQEPKKEDDPGNSES